MDFAKIEIRQSISVGAVFRFASVPQFFAFHFDERVVTYADGFTPVGTVESLLPCCQDLRWCRHILGSRILHVASFSSEEAWRRFIRRYEEDIQIPVSPFALLSTRLVSNGHTYRLSEICE